jgi:hypothetical protein
MVDMGMGILEGGAVPPLSEGMDRLARGRGRKNVVQNGDPFGLGGGVNGALGTVILCDLVGEFEFEIARAWAEPGGWYPVCGRGLCREDVDRVRGRGEGSEGEEGEEVLGLRGLG